MLFRPCLLGCYLSLANYTALLHVLDRVDEELYHVDAGSYEKNDAARGANLFLNLGVWQEIREQNQVIHDDNQLEFVEDVHITIEL